MIHSPTLNLHAQADEATPIPRRSCLPAITPQLQRSYQCIHHAFVVHALHHSRLDAIIDVDGDAISYGRLLMLSGRLAARLQAEGVQRGSRVCLVVHQDALACIVSVLAILRAGATYVPVHGQDVPDDALTAILENVDPVFVVFCKMGLNRAANIRMPYGCLEDMMAECDQYHPMPAVGCADASQTTDIAYIIYEFGALALLCISELCDEPVPFTLQALLENLAQPESVIKRSWKVSA